MVPIGQIDRPADPVRPVDAAGLEGLTRSIREYGVLNPITVVRKDFSYQLVAGVRRALAAQRAGLECVPAFVIEADRQRAFEVGLVENVQRENMSPVDEAKAIEVLMRLSGLSPAKVGIRLGKSEPWVKDRLLLLRLGEPAANAMRSGNLTVAKALSISSKPLEAQAQAAREATPRMGRAPIARPPAPAWRREARALLDVELTEAEGAELVEGVGAIVRGIQSRRGDA